MEWTNVKITNAFIGIEDHGVFAWSLMFAWPGAGQGTGVYTFDSEKIKEIVTKFGQWEDLQGKLVRIGRKHPGATIFSMRDILDDSIEVLFDLPSKPEDK